MAGFRAVVLAIAAAVFAVQGIGAAIRKDQSVSDALSVQAVTQVKSF